MGLDLIERVQSYVLPLQYLMVAVYGQSWKVSILVELTSGAAGLVTIYDLIVIQGRPLIILNYSQWRDPMFERAWQVIGRFSSILRAELHWTLSSCTQVSISIQAQARQRQKTTLQCQHWFTKPTAQWSNLVQALGSR